MKSIVFFTILLFGVAFTQFCAFSDSDETCFIDSDISSSASESIVTSTIGSEAFPASDSSLVLSPPPIFDDYYPSYEYTDGNGAKVKPDPGTYKCEINSRGRVTCTGFEWYQYLSDNGKLNWGFGLFLTISTSFCYVFAWVLFMYFAGQVSAYVKVVFFAASVATIVICQLVYYVAGVVIVLWFITYWTSIAIISWIANSGLDVYSRLCTMVVESTDQLIDTVVWIQTQAVLLFWDVLWRVALFAIYNLILAFIACNLLFLASFPVRYLLRDDPSNDAWTHYIHIVSSFVKTIFVKRYNFNTEWNDALAYISRWKENNYNFGITVSNPHHNHALVRSRAAVLAQHLADKMHFDLFQVQKGHHEDDGSNDIHDPVDLVMDSTGEITSNTLLSFVDVDYYVNMAKYLYGLPAIIYGFSPTCASGTGADMSHYNIDKSVVRFVINGGYETYHQLWDYGADYLSVRGWFFTYVYRVKRVSFPMDRVLTLLVPQTRLLTMLRYFLNFDRHLLRRHVLSHYDAEHDEWWSAFKFWDPTLGLMVTFAQEGIPSTGCTMPYAQLARAVDMYKTLGGAMLTPHNAGIALNDKLAWPYALCRFAPAMAKNKWQLDLIQRGGGASVRTEKPSKPMKDGECQCELHSGPSTDPKNVTSMENVQKPQIQDSGVTVVADNKLVNPLENTVASPARNQDQLLFGYKKRLLEPHQLSEKTKDPKFILSKVDDFITQLLLYTQGKLAPLNCEEAILSSVPPKNREATAEALKQDISKDHDDFRHVRPFVKAEAYASKDKAPRLITPLHPVVQANGYRFVYPLQQKLHWCTWFAFGKEPLRLAKDINLMSRSAFENGWVCFETDYSSWDGSLPLELRKVEERIYKAIYTLSPPDKRALQFYLKYSKNLLTHVGHTAKNTWGARCSGAPDTCLMNTLLNCYINYLAVGIDAFVYGVYGGDDGILFAPLELQERIESTAKACGLTLKLAVRTPQEPFKFLSRWFHWGSNNTCCDVNRAAAKIHICSDKIPPKYREARYKLKLLSLYLNDRNTPVLGPYLKSELDRLAFVDESKLPPNLIPKNWKALMFLGSPWPNEYEVWMSQPPVTDSSLVI